ncbi:MAG TPA: ribonuclease J [Thermoleophilia bacterium]|nr:ribonuclease J [Actinomycetota bacterium]HOU28969.1 ribonuclease J [Thermoleophilia bacterium]HQF51576.1 ribonuclease J [Thermoleophilia bacterium]HQH20630.1 ribonuclease J [Thermoleophilia bacterium]HQJ25896.1 ribonuclease J [Thermoleophilia bacterium]
MTDTVRITPLGGLGEIGKNLTAVEYRGKIVVVDCGIAFPRDEMLGIDLILPDTRWLMEREDDVLAFVLTHGHEDHIGALPFVLRRLTRPVYGSRFTLALVKSKLDEHGLIRSVETNEVSEHSRLALGPFDLSFVAVSHSVPDALAVVLGTDLGAVVVTGDYKFDHTPIDGRITDVNAFARLGEQGVLALLGDSTNATSPGSTASESTVGQAFHQIFAEADGRVILACFASHIHRVQQAIQIAHLHGRRFAVSGRSMQKNVNIARNLGILEVPEGAMIRLAEIDDYRPEEILILTTGSQGEPLSALTRMAFDDHPQVGLNEGDTVVISATPIPGNELSVMNTVNRLLKSGATVIHGRESGVHVSGHASQEDLRMMLNLVRPQYFVPVHGEYRHQHIHRRLARDAGIPEEDIFILENGDVLEIDADNAELVDKVPTGMVFVDGFEIGDEEGLVLRDRQQLAADGILIAVLTVDAQTGDSVAPPELVARGFLHDDERLRDVLAECGAALEDLMGELGAEHVTGQKLIREDVNQCLSELVFRRTRRRPLILPVVVEV